MQIWIALIILLISCNERWTGALVLQSDFGLKDGAVSAMKGVANAVDPKLAIYDLTHEIPAYNIWEAAYRLEQTAVYWPKGTVFVSVVDPGVGTTRKSVTLKTKSGHYFVSPDNGTLTLVAESLGIEAVREIDSSKNRRAGSSASYTFHGRDLYAYTGARLAAGKISFEEIGPDLGKEIFSIKYQSATLDGMIIKGSIPILDIQYGNIWTNISDSLFKKAGFQYGDSVKVLILKNDSTRFSGTIPLARTFGEVPQGKNLSYFNSLMNFSLAINMGDFANTYNIQSGPEWRIEVRK